MLHSQGVPKQTTWSRSALGVGALVPVLYFGTQVIVGALNPDYDFLTQVASDLGASGAPHAGWFNAGALLTGVAALVTTSGLLTAPVQTRARHFLLAACALAILSTGLAAIAAGAFPLPDERHGGGALGAGMFLLPALGAVVLFPHGGGWRAYGLANLALFVGSAAALSGSTPIDEVAWQGLLQRLLAGTVFVAIAVVSVAELRRRQPPEHRGRLGRRGRPRARRAGVTPRVGQVRWWRRREPTGRSGHPAAPAPAGRRSVAGSPCAPNAPCRRSSPPSAAGSSRGA
jgi:hypothetical membrane protein